MLERFSVENSSTGRAETSTLLDELELAFTTLEGSKFKIPLYIFFFPVGLILKMCGYLVEHI